MYQKANVSAPVMLCIEGGTKIYLELSNYTLRLIKIVIYNLLPGW
jgi:hypothetical protein